MDYKITKIETPKGTAYLYVDVEFIDQSGEVVHRNDFVMQIPPTRRVYIGPELAEGETPDLKDYEEQETDVKTEIIGNIERYISRIEARGTSRLDARDPSIKTDQEDPLELKTKLGVVEMIGVIQSKDEAPR